MITPYPGWEPTAAPPDSSSSPPALSVVEQLSIRTPELVAIEFPLAGIGSRFAAALVDYLIQGAAALILLLLVIFIGAAIEWHTGSGPGLGAKWGVALVLVIPFLLMWGYFTLFEAFWRGQTPGKRAMKIRVIQQTGRPVSLFESMTRNLVRVVDMLPTFYIVGAVTMFVTKRQQRVGDLLAGTLVVHEQIAEQGAMSGPAASSHAARTFTAAAFAPQPSVQIVSRESRLPADAVARLGLADLHALEAYLARRLEVPPHVRAQLAQRLAAGLSAKMQMTTPAEGAVQEAFLEEVAFALRGMRP